MSRLGLVLMALAVCAALEAQQVNLLSDPGFEEQEGWEVITRHGGEGGGHVDGALARTGTHSFRLTKTNAVGSIILRAGPVTLQPRVGYTCRFRFHAENATLANALLLRISTGPDEPLAYNCIDGGAGWMSQSLLINSPPGQWEKRVGHYQTDLPQQVFVNVELYGNPCTVWVDDFELLPNDFQPHPVRSDFRDAVTEAQLAEALRARPEATGQVAMRNGRSTLLISGQPVPPIMYKVEPYHLEGDYLRFGQAGVNLATVSVRLGNIRGDPGVWLGKDSYDFSVAEAKLKKALLRNPQALIVLDIWLYPYPQWGTENPGECWTNAQGQRGYGTWGDLEGFTDDLAKTPPGNMGPWWYPSYNSLKWRADASTAAAALIDHLRQTPYAKTIVGYFLTGGHDGQFGVFGSFDYSEAGRAGFQRWLQQKYGTIGKLRAAWKDGPDSFEAVTVPPPAPEVNGMEGLPPYLTPGPALDFRDYSVAQAWDLRDVFSAAVKQAAGKPVFTVAYGSPALYDFSPLLGLKSLDASGAMSYYPYRLPGYAVGFKPFTSFALHGKLFFQELDLRSWSGSMVSDEVYQMWMGGGLTPSQWDAINRKLVGISLANRSGFWYYDMNHYYDAPEIMAEIGKTYDRTQRLSSRPAVQFRPDVCVVESGGAAKYLSSEFSSLNFSHFYQLMALELSGVPYDLHYLSDVLSRPELQRYKVYVFYQTRYLTAAERAGIKQKLQREGHTLVFMHDDGCLTEQGTSVAAQCDLVGMQVQTEEKYGRLTPVTVDHPLTHGVAPSLGLNELLMQIMAQEGQSAVVARTQPFWITDPQATPLARYAEDGRVAAAIKPARGWTSVYLAAPNSLTGDLLNAVARRAGAYVCGPAGQSVAMNGNFLSLHAMRSGEYPLALPPGVKRVTDMDTGKTLPVNGGRCRLQVQAQETYWLQFE